MELNNKVYRIIQECITEAVKKEIQKQRIAKIIKEEYAKLNEKSNQSINMERKYVMSSLKDPKYKHSQLAYALYHPKNKSEKATVRSLFSKEATEKPDADGVVRSFSDDDINQLYQMMRKR